MAIDEAKLAEYRLTWQKHEEERRQAILERQKRAHQAARSAAVILREQFGATRVRLFGSLLYPQSFHKHSDIDLAAEGMDDTLILKAWCAVSATAPEFEFDLVTPDECRPEIWSSMESEGIEL
jgi:uncharacterized protein